MSNGAQEGVWLRRLLEELGFLQLQDLPIKTNNSKILIDLSTFGIPISCDNQGSIKLVKNPIFYASYKHIEIHHHFIRERIPKGE